MLLGHFSQLHDTKVSSIRRIRNAQISGSAADEDRQVLTPERIAKLDEIGFKWSSKNQRHVPWEQRYEELVEFVVRTRSCACATGGTR